MIETSDFTNQFLIAMPNLADPNFFQTVTYICQHNQEGAMGIVINRIPQLGKLSDNVFYAQGYSGHGIALTHIVSEIMANAMTGQMKDYDTFANCKHIRLPGSEWIGNQFLALGMWYYLMLEKLR